MIRAVTAALLLAARLPSLLREGTVAALNTKGLPHLLIVDKTKTLSLAMRVGSPVGAKGRRLMWA